MRLTETSAQGNAMNLEQLQNIVNQQREANKANRARRNETMRQRELLRQLALLSIEARAIRQQTAAASADVQAMTEAYNQCNYHSAANYGKGVK